jgi:glycosyltransferase involved in cell wall biosynthesis
MRRNMKLIFAHDHKLRKIGEKYYTLGGLADFVTERYTALFDELTIICRVIEKQDFDTQLFELNNPHITVKAASNGSLILSRDSKFMIEEEIKSADGLIVKLHSKIAETAIKYAKKYKIPYLVESVACPWDSYWNYSIKGKFVAPIMYLSTKRALKQAPYAIYVTKEFLQKRYPSGGKWIDCSDVELKSTDDAVLEHRLKKITNSKSPFVLGTLAQVDVRYKGQEYVIKAISKLRKKGIEFKYKLAGSGNSSFLRSIAEKYQVTDLVEFCGVLSHSEVFDWLDQIDIYIQPSKQEGLPRAMIEAISRACPALGSTAGGIGELIDKRYVFPKGRVNDICKVLENITIDNLKEQAKRNYDTSKKYKKDYLDEKRNSFYKEFARECANRLKTI